MKSIFQVYEKDWKKLFYLFLLNFIMMFGHTVGLSIATSLLLKKAGIDSLPSMYIINSLGIIIVSLFYFPFIKKFSQTSILKNTFITFSLAIIVARFLIFFNVNWIYPVLYLSASLFGWVYYTQFWSLATELCNIREGKRMFSIVVSAGLLGGGIGGFITKAAVSIIHTNNLLFIWSFSFFLIAIFIGYFEKLIRIDSEKKETRIYKKEPWMETFKKVLIPLQKISLMKTIGITFFVYAIVVYLLDFEFNLVLNREYIAEDSLTKFYGNYYGYFYIITFLIVLFAVPRLLKVFGVGNVILTLPLMVGLGFVILSFNFNLIPVIVIKFIRDMIGNSFIESAFPLLFLPIQELFRHEALIFTESFAIPMGILIAGVTINGFLHYVGPRGLSVLGIILSAIWIYFSFRLKKEYLHSFIKSIEDKTYFEKEEHLHDIMHLGKGKTVEVLVSALYDENEKVSIFAMELLGKIGSRKSSEILLSFTKNSSVDARRRATAILALGSSKDFTVAFDLLPFLKDPDARIRANAIESLGKLDPVMAKDATASMLNDEHPRVRTNAAVILWKYGDREKGLKVLSEMAKDSNPENRVRTIYVLSEMGGPEILPLIEDMMNDPDDEVRLYAAKALENVDNEEALSLLIKMLGDKARKVRHLASQILERKDGSVSKLLLRDMRIESGLAQKEIIFLMIKKRNPEYAPVIIDYCMQEIKLIYETIVRQDTLMKSRLAQDKDSPVGEVFKIIIDSLNTRNERKLFKVLRVLSALQDSQAFMLAVRRYRDYYNPEAQANAIEVIESVIGDRFAKVLLPLLEDTMLHEKAVTARKLWEFNDMDAREIIWSMDYQQNFKGLRLCAEYVLKNIKTSF